jgi:hypothetical protein
VRSTTKVSVKKNNEWGINKISPLINACACNRFRATEKPIQHPKQSRFAMDKLSPNQRGKDNLAATLSPI